MELPQAELPRPVTAASGASGSRPTWSRIGHDLVRVSRGQVLLGVVLCLISMAFVVQVRHHRTDDSYATMRREDLVQLLDNLTAESERQQQAITQLQVTRDQLRSGTDARQVAAREAQQRIDADEILAGTVAAKGPGVRITITDPHQKVTPQILLDGLEELRDAGAEALDINGFRVGMQSYFAADAQGRPTLDGKPLGSPIVITGIGDPQTLEAGARFRGGLVSLIEGPQVGGRVEITQLASVTITSVRAPASFSYAKPS